MKFEGSLVHFFPPDLLILVANLGKEGVLTVTSDALVLTVSVKEGLIIDAQSEKSDSKAMKSLLFNRMINSQNYDTLVRARSETGMPVRQILDRLSLMANDTVRHCYQGAMKEVIFEFFSLDQGFFKFTELDTGLTGDGLALNPQATAMEIAQWIDEARDMEREFSSLNRAVSVTKALGSMTAGERILVHGIKPGVSLRVLVNKSPFPTHTTLKLLKKLVDDRRIALHPVPEADQGVASMPVRGDELFMPFKNASRQILTSTTLSDRMKGVLTFCKSAFDHFFVVSMNSREVVHLLHFYRDDGRALHRTHLRNLPLKNPPDPLFSRILETRAAFFGAYFETGVLEDAIRIRDREQCAVIPYQKHQDTVSFLYVITGRDAPGSSPFRYLEILSWMLNPETGFTSQGAQAVSGDTSLTGTPAPGKPVNPSPALTGVAETVNELPAMPHITTKILNLLSDPGYDQAALIEMISQDQSIMMTLIKIANSVLYRGVHEISTVREAVNRLGAKAIKSIVIASATRTLFPKGELEFSRLSHPLWKHSKECGIIARRMAMELGYHDPEEAFVGGLLHDIGKLAILMSAMESYKAVLKLEEKTQRPGLEVEVEVLGYTHTQVGALLMKKWHMPEPLKRCVEDHHSGILDTEISLTGMVALGDYYAHVLGKGWDPAVFPKPGPVAGLLEKAGISEHAEALIMEKLKADLDQASAFD
ncbi:MAG: HDOD domain-containing protein [Pseudomonadota bacterium]